MDYDDVLEEVSDNLVVRDVCTDQDGFGDVLAAALKIHAAPPPVRTPELTKALQGNLSEYCVWDLGERYWSIFERRMTWTANADSPWKASSSDGVDILALAADNQLVLLVIEVKSSVGRGASLITGGNSSLQSDFDRLFEGPVQNRLPISVGKVLASLRLVHRQPELEEQVKEMVGMAPADCPSLRLMGVLVCKQGNNGDLQARGRAFERLTDHLTDIGWDASQITFRTVEVDDLTELLDEVIERATA